MVRPDVVGFPLTLDEAQHPMLGECLASCSYGQIDGVADAAGRQADIASQIISFAVAEPDRHSSVSPASNRSRVRPDATCNASRTSRSRSYGSCIPTCGR